MYTVKTPLLIKKLYPNLRWNAENSEHCIYITFDDGPIPIVTPFVLNILKQYNAKASFFCIGDNVRKYPAIFEQIKNEGHVVGNHTFNHLNGWETNDSSYFNNFMLADELIGSILFRPPYGKIRRSQIKLFKNIMPDLQIIMWSVLSGDFDLSLKPDNCLKKVLENTRGGDIIVFHDSLKAFERLEYVLPRALAYWSELGYTFKAL